MRPEGQIGLPSEADPERTPLGLPPRKRFPILQGARSAGPSHFPRPAQIPRAAAPFFVITVLDGLRGARGPGLEASLWALYTALLAVLPLQGNVNAYAGVTLPNPASVGLHGATGFQPVGVYRQVGLKCEGWHDVAWFQRPLQQRPGGPPPPRPLEEVRHTAEWVEAPSGGLPPL